MKFRVAALATILLVAPTMAVADIHDEADTTSTTLIDLTSTPQADASPQARQGLSTQNSAGGYQILTEPLEADTFFVAGVTWEGPAPDTVEIRVLESGEWGSWYSLEIETGEGGNDGTEPFIAGAADGVQARVSGADMPEDLTLVLTSGGDDTAEETAPTPASIAPAPGTDYDVAVNADDVAVEPLLEQAVPGATTAPQTVTGQSAAPQSQPQSLSSDAVPAPNVISRAGWGETRVPPAWKTSYATLGGAVIHHTAGTNSYTEAQAPSVVQSVHDYHTYSWGRGWDDIGYNFLVDKYGNIYEGRYGTLASSDTTMVVGGHAAPANTGSVGISVMGTYTGSIQPTAESITAIEDIIAWQFSAAGVDPHGTWTFFNSRTGGYTTVPAVLGHRDVSATVCPGNIYQLLPSIRSSVDTKIAQGGEPVRGDNDIALYKTNDFGPIANSVQYFGKSGDEVYVGNVLGRGDLPFIRRGNTFTFAEGPGSPTTTRTYTLGQASQEVYTGDIDGNGRESVILRTGNRFDIYDDVTTNRPTRSINFGRAGDEVFVFDWDGDGQDEIAVRRGNTFYLKWMVTSGNADREINYGRKGDEVYVGSWSGSGNETITVRRGNRYYMSYSNVSGNADREFNYGRATDDVVVGDWNGDGKDGLGVVRDLTK